MFHDQIRWEGQLKEGDDQRLLKSGAVISP